MHEINGSLAIIMPKAPYIKWANSLPDADREFSSAAFRKDCITLLIPEYDTVGEARVEITKIWQDIFEYELEGWCTHEAWWPQNRTQKMFWQWFGVEFHSTVFETEALKKDA